MIDRGTTWPRGTQSLKDAVSKDGHPTMILNLGRESLRFRRHLSIGNQPWNWRRATP